MFGKLQNQVHYRMRQYQKLSSIPGNVIPGPPEEPPHPALILTFILAAFYVLSGVTQPLIMTLANEAGIAEPRCQIYMVFYYFGPATVSFVVPQNGGWPPVRILLRSACVAGFDIVAQTMNYTGATMAGPTIFAIIYSSVTVWTAVFSRLLLSRSLNLCQWLGVGMVFLGLGLTGLNSVQLGPDVLRGAILVIFGSAMHALTYVLSEALMTTQTGDRITVQANCALQGLVACAALSMWQIIYTRPRFEKLIQVPVQESGATWLVVTGTLFAFAFANLVHSFCFFHTLRFFPGGSTSAGVMKGLQAVLVFAVTSLLYCGRVGGAEMCFTRIKFASLIVVVFGIVVFGKATEKQKTKLSAIKAGYSAIEIEVDV
jgi:drug/metabolite transporter (DMT)-like permease